MSHTHPIHFRRSPMDRKINTMSTDQKRLVFGLAFQHWDIADWFELFGDFPSGWEFAA